MLLYMINVVLNFITGKNEKTVKTNSSFNSIPPLRALFTECRALFIVYKARVWYGVATMSRRLKMIGLFRRILSLL